METSVIIPLPNTSVADILRALQQAREDGGAVALGRVLTLVITTTDDKVEKVIVRQSVLVVNHRGPQLLLLAQRRLQMCHLR